MAVLGASKVATMELRLGVAASLGGVLLNDHRALHHPSWFFLCFLLSRHACHHRFFFLSSCLHFSAEVRAIDLELEIWVTLHLRSDCDRHHLVGGHSSCPTLCSNACRNGSSTPMRPSPFVGTHCIAKVHCW